MIFMNRETGELFVKHESDMAQIVTYPVSMGEASINAFIDMNDRLGYEFIGLL